jgi:hypothetical protein
VAVKNFTLPIDDPELLRVWCPYEREMFAGRPKPDPLPAPLPVWFVAKNGTYPTRPAYTPTGATLGASTGRATVGAVCNGTAFVLGSSTYMPFVGALPGQVALCNKASL